MHVVSVNDYLVTRDAEIMRPLYETLGVSVGTIQEGAVLDVKLQATSEEGWMVEREAYYSALSRLTGATDVAHEPTDHDPSNRNPTMHLESIIEQLFQHLVSGDRRRTRAFVGRPRREGAAIPVEASFDQATRTMTVRFPQPPQPGQTVTLALLPVNNPTWADTYMFSVQALPAGPNPVPASLGFATMPIYNFNP